MKSVVVFAECKGLIEKAFTFTFLLLGKEDTMKTIHTEFQQFCRNNFSSTDIGDTIYRFYRKHILFSSSQKAQHQKNLTLVRKHHISTLLVDFGEDSIIEVVNSFIEKVNKGEFVEINSVYFYACVKNESIKTNNVIINKTNLKPIKKENLIKKISTEAHVTNGEVLTPIIIKRLPQQLLDTCQTKEEQFLYKCPKCSNKIFGLSIMCSVCKSKLDYATINYAEVIK